MENIVHVGCPNCNKRLFDLEYGSTGNVAIKCPRCRAVISIKLQNEKMK